MRNGNSAKRRADVGDRSFYLTLAICAAAVLVSGYVLFFMPSGREEPAMEDIPLPVTVPIDVTYEPEDPEPVLAEENVPAEAETVPETVPAAAEAKPQKPVWVKPTAGGLMRPYSGSELVYQTTFGDWRVHSGADYAGAVGDRVYAVTSGKVAKVWVDGLWGKCVLLEHGDGLETLYCGLGDKTKAKEGGTVQAGDVLGTIGETSPAESADPPHLHLEATRDGQRIDPEELPYSKSNS